MSDATPDHTQRAHSHLGASSSHRWLACPGSIRLSVGMPNTTSIFAAHGTAAHELGEKCLRANFADAANYLGEEIVVGNHTFEVDDEMVEAVQLYVDTVKADYEPGDILLIEHRFTLEHVFPGMFGTNDAGLYSLRDKTLRVYDLKYGQGYAVEAEENPQLQYYGVGAVAIPSLRGVPLEHVELVIVQPRAPHRDGPVRRWMTNPFDLLAFQEELRAGAVLTEDPNSTLLAGSHCKFCPAAGICPALREVAIVQAQAEFADVVPQDLSEADLADLLEKTDLIEDGLRAIRAEAFNRAQGGAKIPGYKLVAKRAVRKWRDEGATVAKLVVNFDLKSEDIYARKLLSPAQIEKLLPKSERDGLADLVLAESSGVTLARDTDRRTEARPQRSAADDFDPIH